MGASAWVLLVRQKWACAQKLVLGIQTRQRKFQHCARFGIPTKSPIIFLML